MHALLSVRPGAFALLLLTVACTATPAPPSAPVANGAAKTEEAEYERLCAGAPSEQRAMCPMGAWTDAIEDIEGGVLLHLNHSAPSPEETQKRMRCHRAWMAHDPSNAMPRCPLGSPGVEINAKPGAAGTDLALTAPKPEEVKEVRRRTHAALGK